jgi:hypothetical protein
VCRVVADGEREGPATQGAARAYAAISQINRDGNPGSLPHGLAAMDNRSVANP